MNDNQNESHSKLNKLIEQDDKSSSSTLPNYTSFGIEKSLSVNVNEGIINNELLTPTNFSIFPSLRGRLFHDNDIVKCVGEWAMTDSAHGIAGQTSEFEFQLSNPTSNINQFPISGKYTGWFHLKQPMKPPLKIEDKDLNIDFQKSIHNDNYDITGSGQNKFGKFSLYGTYETSSSKVQMYRVYTPKKTNQTPKSTKGSTKSSAAAPTSFASPRATKSATTPAAAAITPSPRETLGQRIRKPSAILTGSFETSLSTPSTPTVTPGHNKRQHIEITSNGNNTTNSNISNNGLSSTSGTISTGTNPTSTTANASTSGRAHRAPPFLAKCRDILKELGKQAQSIYFNEPVDPIKLNIPDYLTIIKEPMDFSLIKKNLENHFYTTHEQYAEHMRLVFRNAIAYNVRRDNPVHIAARELSDMFEERYRVMVSQLSTYAVNFEEPILPPPKKGTGRSRGTKSLGSVRPTTGPRDFALDSSAQAMRMMQQKMLEMEAEINSLRTAVRQSDIRATLGHQMVAAQAPLTYEEKKILIANIMKLDGEQMTAVVDIIQSAMPTTACGDGDEVEIPVDELDTYTLRKLQDYVQNALLAKSKKRNSIPPSPSTKSKSQGAKRARSNGNSNSTNNNSTPTNGATSIPPPFPTSTATSVVNNNSTPVVQNNIPSQIPNPSSTSSLSLSSSASSMMPLPLQVNNNNNNNNISTSATPTFFSNQSYYSTSGNNQNINSGNSHNNNSSSSYLDSDLSKIENVGRKRSNSLDFFPVDDDDHNNDDSNDISNQDSNVHIENSEAWKMVASNPTLVSSSSSLSSSSSTLLPGQVQNLTRQPSDWGDALYEKQISESRKIALQVEAEKSKELRNKLEEERLNALTLEREALQRSLMSNDEYENSTKELELIRQKERQNREDLTATLELSDAHSVLYSHDNNLYDL